MSIVSGISSNSWDSLLNGLSQSGSGTPSQSGSSGADAACSGDPMDTFELMLEQNQLAMESDLLEGLYSASWASSSSFFDLAISVNNFNIMNSSGLLRTNPDLVQSFMGTGASTSTGSDSLLSALEALGPDPENSSLPGSLLDLLA